MKAFLEELWRIRNIIIVFLTPIILLPLPLVAGTPVSTRKLLHKLKGEAAMPGDKVFINC